MKIIISDPLPSSATELLEMEGWTVDAQSGRPTEKLSTDIKDADALIVRSATKVTAELIPLHLIFALSPAQGQASTMLI